MDSATSDSQDLDVIKHLRGMAAPEDSGYGSDYVTSPSDSVDCQFRVPLPPIGLTSSYTDVRGPIDKSFILTSTPLSCRKHDGYSFAKQLSFVLSPCPDSLLDVIAEEGIRCHQMSDSRSLNDNSLEEMMVVDPPTDKGKIISCGIPFKFPDSVLAALITPGQELPLRRLLEIVTPSDLLSLSQVNKRLRSFIISCGILNKRRLSVIESAVKEFQQVGKENYKQAKQIDQEETAAKASPRKMLGDVKNIANSPVMPLIKKANICSLHDRFRSEGQKLSKGENLQKCPHCRGPAREQASVHSASCANVECNFTFCTRCFLAMHVKPMECGVLKRLARSPRKPGKGIVASRSKKNLRRL